MALDSAVKRAGALRLSVPHSILSPPDSSVDDVDQILLLGLYPGIAPAAPSTEINSHAKRASIPNFATPFVVNLPPPVSGVDDGDRLHSMHLYAGITPDSPSSQTGSSANKAPYKIG